MNHYPEFQPQIFSRGDSVWVEGPDGQLVRGSVTHSRQTKYGFGDKSEFEYWVKDETGQQYLLPKEKIYSYGQRADSHSQSGGSESIATIESSPPEDDFGPLQFDSPDSLADHLHGGGQAYYTPADGGGNSSVPVHDVWLGQAGNLSQFIDFDSLRSGQSRLTARNPHPPATVPRVNGFTEGEIHHRMQHGLDFDSFGPQELAARVDGGPSLQEMLADRENLGTRENVSAWVQQQAAQQAAVVQSASSSTSVPSATQEAQSPNSSSSSGDSDGGSSQAKRSFMDYAQMGLDALGVADPTPIADGANAMLSLGRMVVDPANAGKHLKNAGISLASMIPYVGDSAKLLKYGSKARKASHAASDSGGLAESASRIAKMFSDSDAEFEGLMQDFLQGSSGESPNQPSDDRLSSSGNSSGDGGRGGNGGVNDTPPGGDDSGSHSSSDGDPDKILTRKNLSSFGEAIVEWTGIIGTAAAATYTFSELQGKVNQTYIEYQRGLVKHNGQLMAAYADLDRNRWFREREQADYQAPALSGMVQSQDKLEAALQGLRNDWQVIGTDAQMILTEISARLVSLLDYMEPFSEAYTAIRSSIFGKSEYIPNEFDKQIDEVKRQGALEQERQGRRKL
ncbi:MAG: hypothetical protein KF752_11695 [Pirellulaceae bacterium]|nr:hypothetical protein [Pirellulaceae bacterium]